MSSSPRILVAYYSETGTTKAVADIIHDIVGGDIFEIKSTNNYPSTYHELTQVAQREQAQNARPGLLNELAHPNDYDVIILGNPCWWGTFPMVTFTFLEKYGFENKTILPFDTHGGSGIGRMVSDAKKLCPKATVTDGLAIGSSRSRSCRSDVEKWLKKHKII
ncbi:hypothetical protein TVAG_467740 [Trichomonas vaginalis G3]|uniref:Flavodoxin-like domain-containing protein n=1 Tax=Trichomonas vaginalis (strain ATCC PRA-98 / G3) TaxID=412133 RepID=A2E0L4_TRIV3|nr:exported protein-related family [Trichomonas vaginalis G3]EAY13759.1 hypothetical protein TVAG_467740 [Trichomonas vaginalis G3]KAI5542725.1 exported protein-related family [Trichomonas vaginalis G3]|eukprot:XP_001325982.1 hypothetical protein [Trichomonas vaginalis G3]